MVLGTSLPEFNPDKFPLLWPNYLEEAMIAQISMNLSTDKPGIVIFPINWAYLLLEPWMPHCDGA
jgi:hypothetical protein